MRLTVIVPAFNEEAYLAPTLGSIRAAAEEARAAAGVDVDVVVVDNVSADGTGALARDLGATVVHEPVQGIARARNAGARRAAGDVLVFVDADVIVPRTLLVAMCAAMRDPSCVGGGVDVDYQPRRSLVRLYLRLWRLLARVTGMVQGAAQFCRKEVFEEIGGYDEGVWMGEDVDFHWSLRKLARRTGRQRPLRAGTARETLLPALRQVARVEDPGLDQPRRHRAVPPPEGGLERLVLGRGALRGRLVLHFDKSPCCG